MRDIAIRVENLSKRYRIGKDQSGSPGRKMIAQRLAGPFGYLTSTLREPDPDEIIWALKDVSFAVEQGEVVGIIGRNGAGKSTLLKILSRITEPTTGEAEIFGRVGSLLEVGTGFHPELTGRENIYLNGAILGMKKGEIDRKFDEIVEFSGVQKFIDTQVKRYSSGMRVRLAFSVAAHLEPEILLVDEVLAVGDAAFQSKCLGKMKDVATEGRTVLFVSHNMTAIQSLCRRCVLLGAGRIVLDADVETTIRRYLETNVHRGEVVLRPDTGRQKSATAFFERVRIINDQGKITESIPTGGNVVVEITFRCRQPVHNIGFAVVLRGPMLERIVQVTSRITHGAMPPARSGGTVRVQIENLNLVPGSYYASVGMSSQDEEIDHLENILELDITPRDIYGTGKIPKYGWALIHLPCAWEVDYT